MLYIISLRKQHTDEEITYKVFDTYSGSVISLKTKSLRRILEHTKSQAANAQIDNDIIKIKDWENSTYTNESQFIGNDFATRKSGPKYVRVANGCNINRVIDSYGRIYNMGNTDFNNAVDQENVINTEITDIYKIYRDKEFEDEIGIKYNNFIAKAMLLGFRDITFQYEIENKEVRLKSYTGKNKDIIIPPFITAIKAEAFKGKNIKSVILSHGLKAIGPKAFWTEGVTSVGIENIEIPETVELIGNNAFTGNRYLISSNGIINKRRFKLLNEENTVLEQ